MAATIAVAASAAAADFPKPLFMDNSPDPGVLQVGKSWYVYHTSGRHRSGVFPILKSDDLTSWTRVGFIFPHNSMPKWASRSYQWWAPEVHKVNGKYIAYYTAKQDTTKQFAVGAAIADAPEGPFIDVGKPIITTKGVGLIDVNYFKDPRTGKHYLIWKEDSNAFDPPKPTHLLMAEMEPDGLTTRGEHHRLLRNDLKWEGDLVEAPSMVWRDGYYYLFYSANAYYDDRYAVGVARSKSLFGPYKKLPKPILKSDKLFSGPGHQFLVQDSSGRWLMFYHARVKAGGKTSRYLMLDQIEWGGDGWPKVAGGTGS